MPDLDFRQFGRDIAPSEPVNVIELRSGDVPVVILLSEKHNDNVTIADNVQTIVKLLDARIVSQVFVEELFSGEVRQQVDDECRRFYKCENLRQRHEQIRRQYGSDADVFAAMRSVIDKKLSFARWVLFLRPHASAMCIEHPDRKQEAGSRPGRRGNLQRARPGGEPRSGAHPKTREVATA